MSSDFKTSCFVISSKLSFVLDHTIFGKFLTRAVGFAYSASLLVLIPALDKWAIHSLQVFCVSNDKKLEAISL